jgi:hypothetical protein
MFAAKNHESSKTDSKAAGHEQSKSPEVQHSPLNPIWQRFATGTLGQFGSVASLLPIQAKLAISQPNDPFEQEADRIADQVVRMPDPAACHKPT